MGLRLDSRKERFFSSVKRAFTPALMPTQPHTQLIPRIVSFTRSKAAGSEGNRCWRTLVPIMRQTMQSYDRITLWRGTLLRTGKLLFLTLMWVHTIINDMNVHPSLQIKSIKLELIRYYATIDYNLQQTYFNDNSDSSSAKSAAIK
jgi:hypothetical protein